MNPVTLSVPMTTNCEDSGLDQILATSYNCKRPGRIISEQAEHLPKFLFWWLEAGLSCHTMGKTSLNSGNLQSDGTVATYYQEKQFYWIEVNIANQKVKEALD